VRVENQPDTVKVIPIERLALGMYVHDLGLSWLDHPFVHNHCLVSDAATLDRIAATGIREICIDTARGLDPDSAPGPVQADPAQPAPRATPAAGEAPTSLREELGCATRVQQEAARVATRLLQDARAGRQMEVERLEPVVAGMVTSVFRNQNALLGLGRIRRMDHYTFRALGQRGGPRHRPGPGAGSRPRHDPPDRHGSHAARRGQGADPR
jgi:hypothetical protein